MMPRRTNSAPGSMTVVDYGGLRRSAAGARGAGAGVRMRTGCHVRFKEKKAKTLPAWRRANQPNMGRSTRAGAPGCTRTTYPLIH